MLIVRPLPHQTQGEDLSVCWREVQVDPGVIVERWESVEE